MITVLKYICVIFAALSICDLFALFVYSIRFVPTGLSEAICYPFYIPMKMQIALLIRFIQIILLVPGIIFFAALNSTWHIWLPIVVAVVAVVNSIIYCLVSY